ncbi:hypothetical protein D3C78_1061640 [compost metagenome]
MGVGEVDHGAEERRQDGIEVSAGSRRNAPGDEIGAVLREPDEAVDVLDELQGHTALVRLTHAQHDRQLRGAPADQADDLHRQIQVLLAQAPAEDHARVGRIGAEGDFRVLQRADQFHPQLMGIQGPHDGLGAVEHDAVFMAMGIGHDQYRVTLRERWGQRRLRVAH